MPARSERQRRYLAARFGIEWMRRHHFDNTGSLPARKEAVRRELKRRRKTKRPAS